ncbi:MAG TPA: DUF2442 domain-containing protein [Candidatus Kapabacteria bacterium]|nr:DUF2442 domain-containing protein [Candidatus Kapabacteria bacterium]
MGLTIIAAEYIKDYKIRLVFSGNEERIIDFEPFLKLAGNPMTRKLLDINEFKKFKIEYGDLIWNDYEMCFPIIDLYENNILRNISPAAQAA